MGLEKVTFKQDVNEFRERVVNWKKFPAQEVGLFKFLFGILVKQ